MDQYTIAIIMIVAGGLLIYFTGGLVFLGGMYLLIKGVFNFFRK